MSRNSRKKRSERKKAAKKIQAFIRSRSNKSKSKKTEKAISTGILARDNKESVVKVEKEIDNIKDMLKSNQGSQRKSKFLRNVILISLLGLGSVTAYGALDDIKDKLDEFNTARKEGKMRSFMKGQMPSRPKSFADFRSGSARRMRNIGKYTRGGSGKVYRDIKSSPGKAYSGIKAAPGRAYSGIKAAPGRAYTALRTPDKYLRGKISKWRKGAKTEPAKPAANPTTEQVQGAVGYYLRDRPEVYQRRRSRQSARRGSRKYR